MSRVEWTEEDEKQLREIRASFAEAGEGQRLLGVEEGAKRRVLDAVIELLLDMEEDARKAEGADAHTRSYLAGKAAAYAVARSVISTRMLKGPGEEGK